MSEAKTVTLFCVESTANKEYQIHLEPSGNGGYLVNFAFGRRGSALKQGTKTQEPVSLDAATKIFTKLLAEKQAKGYTEAESGQRYVGTALAGRDSGLTPQLPTAIDPGEVARYERDDDWFAQEKFDGQNRMVTMTTDEIGGVNRRGLTCPVPAHWNAADIPTKGRTVLCGEDMGDHLVAFDIIEHNGECVRNLNALQRHALLTSLSEAWGPVSWLKIAPIATETAEKQALLEKIITTDKEGVVYKNKYASFDAGRSLNAVKHKIQESSTFVVAKINDKRSVQIALHDNDNHLVPMGNVTVPANYPVPAVGALVEVEYMYRFEGGALMQPKYKGERTDIDGPVTVSQIRRIMMKK